MDRRLRYGLLGVGLFLLLFALIERAYAYPRLAKVPLGVYSVPVAEGIGSYFDTGRLEMVRGARLRTTRVVKGDRGAGRPRVAVWDMFLNTVDLDTGRRLSLTQERVVFDRVSGLPVRCCGESPRHDGIMLNFPGGTRLRPDGLPGSLGGQPGVYSIAAAVVLDDDKTMWVEPVTSRIVKGQDHSRQMVRDAAGTTYLTAFDATLTYTDDTVAGNLAAARDDLGGLRLAGVVLPVTAGLVGALLLAVGLLAPASRRPPPAPDRPEPGRGMWVVGRDGVAERPGPGA